MSRWKQVTRAHNLSDQRALVFSATRTSGPVPWTGIYAVPGDNSAKALEQKNNWDRITFFLANNGVCVCVCVFFSSHASFDECTKRRETVHMNSATGFRCPESTRRGIETRNAGRLKRWESLVDVGQSKNEVMQRHENFLSNQEKVTHRDE